MRCASYLGLMRDTHRLVCEAISLHVLGGDQELPFSPLWPNVNLNSESTWGRDSSEQIWPRAANKARKLRLEILYFHDGIIILEMQPAGENPAARKVAGLNSFSQLISIIHIGDFAQFRRRLRQSATRRNWRFNQVHYQPAAVSTRSD